MLLCRRHHRAVHEEGWTIARNVIGEAVFVRPDGRALDTAPSVPAWAVGAGGPLAPVEGSLNAAGIVIDADATPRWDGQPFDVACTLDVLRPATRKHELTPGDAGL